MAEARNNRGNKEALTTAGEAEQKVWPLPFKVCRVVDNIRLGLMQREISCTGEAEESFKDPWEGLWVPL